MRHAFPGTGETGPVVRASRRESRQSFQNAEAFSRIQPS